MKNSLQSFLNGYKALILLIVLSGVNINTFAQDSKGTEFWICFPGNQGSPGTQLYITGEQASTVTINIPGIGFNQVVNVTAGGLQTVNLPGSVQVQTQFVADNKGIHITATKEVTVYGMNAQAATTDAFLAFPVDALGKDYYVMGYNRDFSFSIPTQATIVATENNTTVTLNTTVTGGGFTAGTPGNIVLQKGQVYQLRSLSVNADYTGTRVTADKPIGVFGGAQCTNISGNLRACDHLVEQLPPLSAWGKNFVTVPLATRTAGDVFRFMAQKNGTAVSVNGIVVANLNAGQIDERILSSTSYNRITSNEPILVGQYSRSSQADGVTSDPFFALVPPDEQFLNFYVISAGTSNIPNNFANITSPTANKGTVKVDGTVVNAGLWNVIPGTSFSGAKVPLTAGVHTVSSSLPIGLLVYGFGSFDSYGYLGGQSFSAVATVESITLTPESGTAVKGSEQCFKAVVKDQFGKVVPGVRVDFAITGANPGSSGFSFADASGQATFCYTGNNNGTDKITASVGDINDVSTFIWTLPSNVYYSKPTGDLHNVLTWGINPDGSGANPTDFGIGKVFNLANRTVVYALTGNWTVSGTLFRPAGSQLHINAFTLSVATLTGTGTFNGTTASNLIIAGAAGGNIGNINFTPGAGLLNNLTLNRTGSGAAATVGNALSVFGVLTVSNGMLNANNALTLKSNATNTARVAPVTGSIGGNVTVERYVPARRAWRMMNAPVNGTQSVNSAWQEGAASATSNPNPGFGTHITGGKLYGSAANGFDVNTNGFSTSSLLMYSNSSDSWNAVPNTNSTTVGNKPFMLFVRGSRGIMLNGPAIAASNTVLRATGTLKTGNQMMPVAASGFTAVPNPFASPIDFHTVTKTNVPDNFYVWDPKLGGLHGVGAYVNLSWNTVTNTYDITPTPVSNESQYIQSGQSFIVKSNGAAGSLLIKESDKSATPATNVFRTTTNSAPAAGEAMRSSHALQGIRVNLQIEENDNSKAVLDGIFMSYHKTYSASIDDQDIIKLSNFNENLALAREGKALMVDRRPLAVFNDTIQLKLWNTTIRSYVMQVEPINMISSGLYLYLKDNYLGTTVPIDISKVTHVPFVVNNDAASSSIDRFAMVVATKEAPIESLLANGITTFPNPVKGRTINVRLINQPAGNYQVVLFNSIGQLVYSGQIKHAGGSAIQVIQLKNKLTNGIYQLQLLNGKAKTTLKVMGN